MAARPELLDVRRMAGEEVRGHGVDSEAQRRKHIRHIHDKHLRSDTCVLATLGNCRVDEIRRIGENSNISLSPCII